MSALAVFLEREGFATIVVGLIRLHLEKIAPPRALWVPFELGRPLGAFTDGGKFQQRVLSAALALLDEPDSPPVLAEFDGDDPGSAADPKWKAPDLNANDSLTREVQALMPRWLKAQDRLGRTMTGLSGMPIDQAADYVEKFDTSQPAINPDESMSDLLRMRFCADDLKTFYSETALAEGNPNSQQIGRWLWSSTAIARELRRIREKNLDHEKSARATVCGRLLIPGAYL